MMYFYQQVTNYDWRQTGEKVGNCTTSQTGVKTTENKSSDSETRLHN